MIVVVFDMPLMLEVNVDVVAESGTIPPTEKEGSNERIAENRDMSTKDVAPDEVNPSKVSKSISSQVKRGERAEWTSSQIKARKSIAKKQKKTPAKDAVTAEGVADTDGKATLSKSAMMKQKETPTKEAIVFTAPFPKSTAKKQKKKAVEDAVTAKSKDNASNKATPYAPPLKSPKKKQNKTSAKETVSAWGTYDAVIKATSPKSLPKKQKGNAADDAVAAGSNITVP